LAEVGKVFQQNLAALDTVASIPFSLIQNAVLSRRFHAFATAERIRLLPLSADEEIQNSDQIADERAHSRLNEELSTKEGTQEVLNAVLTDLAHTLTTPEISMAADELLRQGTVIAWSSLEVLASDLAVAAVNANPKLASKLMTDNDTKSYFPKGISPEELDEHAFDLKGSMGTVLFADRRPDTIEKMRNVFSVLLPGSDAQRRLRDTNLWILSQRRNLIVHKRGVIDRGYLSKTPDNATTGSRLVVTRFDLDHYVDAVQSAGVALLQDIPSILPVSGAD
jgi:hypothetical protein